MNVKEVFGLFILTELLKFDHEFFQFYLDFHDLFQGDGVQLEMVFQQFEISLENIGRKIGVEITHMKNAGQCFECFKFFLEPFIEIDRKSTRLNSSHVAISYAVFCLKKKNKNSDKK